MPCRSICCSMPAAAAARPPPPNPSLDALPRPQTLTCLAAATPNPCLAAADWQFLFIKGSIRTRMLVHEDPTAGALFQFSWAVMCWAGLGWAARPPLLLGQGHQLGGQRKLPSRPFQSLACRRPSYPARRSNFTIPTTPPAGTIHVRLATLNFQPIFHSNHSNLHFYSFRPAGTIHVKLAPSGGNAPLQHLNAKWRFDAGALQGPWQAVGAAVCVSMQASPCTHIVGQPLHQHCRASPCTHIARHRCLLPANLSFWNATMPSALRRLQPLQLPRDFGTGGAPKGPAPLLPQRIPSHGGAAGGHRLPGLHWLPGLHHGCRCRGTLAHAHGPHHAARHSHASCHSHASSH